VTIKDELKGLPISRQLRYYRRHKADPDFRRRLCETSKRYYQSHREAILKRLKASYKARKEALHGHTAV